MKKMHAIGTVSVLALVAFGGAALAADTTQPLPTTQSKTGAADDTGMSTLGVDISQAGDTSASVQSFLSGLPPDQATQVKTGCQSVLADQGNQNANVLSFCKLAIGSQ